MMGNIETITRTKYPKQGQFLHASVRVCFHYDTSFLVGGVIVRDDAEAPWQTIIRLDDGRFVLATECQYSTGTRMTTDNRSVSDELLGAAVRDATATLNRALKAAHDAGLLASVDTDEMREMGRLTPLVIVRVTVSRPL